MTGSAAANQLAEQADVILAVGTRLQDFTTGSRALFESSDKTLIALNVGRFDSLKHQAREQTGTLKREWAEIVRNVTADQGLALPTDAQVIGAVNRQAGNDTTVVCAAGGLPGELHKLWQCSGPGSYHVEYGFSCMGWPSQSGKWW